MGPKKDVIDIVTELGGIRTAEAADKVFAERIKSDQLAKLDKVKNEAVRMKKKYQRYRREHQVLHDVRKITFGL